ncbi:putative uncharacterized protein DDB_G0282133 [Condylostylus longicornis]|uniref:putative uncharacterized protein DDB_G0282133 n=1 Tax=Condylostylus longicornis TaxID=2530218 RepID=UPI00244E4373|nr:putative uncharacterized protein DDB_G0282133 [Condylostylus longicornis]
MKTSRLQAAFARKREAENIRFERTQETNRYFDHWGKVTSRFQTWTTPEYYENAEKSLKKQKEERMKEEKLNERREKLQKLLEMENQQYENELQAIMLRKQSPSVLLSGRRSKYDSIDTNILEKIKENRAEEMRRLELEAKLYKKWRNPMSGVTLSTTPLAIIGTNEHLKEKSLFESKSDNEVMAKLNWLDKQIENQMRREEEEKETQKRILKLQEEARKREEIQRERQLIRESEIKELRALQENHVKALKQREQETTQLQQDEEHYRHILDTIENEITILKLNYEDFSKQLNEVNLPHNLNKIKILFRQLSEEFNERFQKDIECLKRIKILYSYSENSTFDATQNEILNQSDISNMYESEAKNNFKKWKEYWYNEETNRKTKIIDLLERDQIYYDLKLSENLKQQKIVLEIRETHLAAIENSNDKLKMLINSNNTAGSVTEKTTELEKSLEAINLNQKNPNNDINNRTGSNIFWNQTPRNDHTSTDPKLMNGNRNVSRCSSRISNIYDLNSYREESANSYKNTKSRIFSWIDDDNADDNNNANNSNYNNGSNNKNISGIGKSQLNGRNNFNRRKFTSNTIDSSIPITDNAVLSTREDLIKNFRQRNSSHFNTNDDNLLSRSIQANGNSSNVNNKNIEENIKKFQYNREYDHINNNFNNNDCNDNLDKRTTATIPIIDEENKMKFSENNKILESSCRKIENNSRINNENNKTNLNNNNGNDNNNNNKNDNSFHNDNFNNSGSSGPKFGKKKVAWT